MKKNIFIIVAILFVNLVSAQEVMVQPPDPEEPDYSPYIFIMNGYLTRDIKFDKNKMYSQSDSLELFLLDSIGFHKAYFYNHAQQPHACQNRYYKLGFINTDGETVIPFEYDWIQSKYDSLLFSSKAGLTGIINSSGKIIIPFDCSTVYIKENNLLGFTRSKRDSSITFCDTNGTFLFSIDGYSAKKLGEDHIVIANKDDSFKGVIDYKGKWIVKPETYLNVKWIKDGFICTSIKGKEGIMKLEGKIILQFEYANIHPTEKKQFIVYKNGTSGVINSKNKFIIPLDSVSITDFGVFYIVKKYRSDVSRLITAAGKQELAEKYNINIPAPSEPVKSKKNHFESVIMIKDTTSGLLGMYRADGTKVIPIENSFINYRQDYGAIIIQKKKPAGLVEYAAVNIDGKMIVPFSQNQLQFIERSPKLLLATNPEKKSAFINVETGNVFTSFEYEYISYENILTNGYTTAKKNWLYALISPDGKMLTEAAYSRFYPVTKETRAKFTEEIVCTGVKNNKLYGITKTGIEITQIMK